MIMLEDDFIFDSLELYCPYENLNDKGCEGCIPNLEGKRLLRFQYRHDRPNGKCIIFYTCMGEFSFSVDTLERYNKNIIYEE
ncbi:MAG: hypothetical protein OQK82_03290 [Candidatus Pacearchaeota archaeon]|nr:hypothetical protein [Candidatus Pacearchaeota archaeon]